MATAAAIRAGLAAAITGAITDAQCTGYLLSEPTPPAFEIEPAGVEYDQAFVRGLDEWTWTVRGFVGTASEQGAQVSLDTWLKSSGTGSVKAALEADLTLGGACQSLHVTNVSAPKTYAVASQPNVLYLGAEWAVRIIAAG